MRTMNTIAGLALAALAAPALGQTVSMELIPGASGVFDMSPDGRWIVGSTLSGFPFRYDTVNDTMLILPSPATSANAVSDDGTVVLGSIPNPEPLDDAPVAAIWHEGTSTWTSLGYLPDALACPSRSSPYDLSADGTVATGLSWDGCSAVAFRWSHATGMVPMEVLGNGGNRASVMSADGNVMGGFAQGSFARTPTVWHADGTGILLDPPNGDVVGEVRAMTDDGSAVYGNWDGDAFKWTEANGMEVVGQGSLIPSWTGNVQGVADDEGTVVGFDINFTSRRAWIQPGGTGDLVLLSDYVTTHGGTIPEGAATEVAYAISRDGTIIAGHGAFTTAWIVRITHPSCTGDVDGNDMVDFQDLLAVLANWGTDGPGADIAEPTDVVDFADLLGVLSNWGPCGA